MTFWWFDGRRYKDNTADPLVDYWASDTVVNKFQEFTTTLQYHVDNSILSAVPAAAAAIALSIMYAF